MTLINSEITTVQVKLIVDLQFSHFLVENYHYDPRLSTIFQMPDVVITDSFKGTRVSAYM